MVLHNIDVGRRKVVHGANNQRSNFSARSKRSWGDKRSVAIHGDCCSRKPFSQLQFTACLVSLCWTCFVGLFFGSRQTYFTMWTWETTLYLYSLSMFHCWIIQQVKQQVLLLVLTRPVYEFHKGARNSSLTRLYYENHSPPRGRAMQNCARNVLNRWWATTDILAYIAF